MASEPVRSGKRARRFVKRVAAGLYVTTTHPNNDAAGTSAHNPIDLIEQEDVEDEVCSTNNTASNKPAARMVSPHEQQHKPENCRSDEQRLELGTFADGRSIYRNRLHSYELLENGHLDIANLPLPDTELALCTTFSQSSPVAWLEAMFGDIPNLIVVCHDMRRQCRYVGDAELVPIISGDTDDDDMNWQESQESQQSADYCNREEPKPEQKRWYWLFCKPHTGGCLHGKLLLFRNKAGLRVVVSGNNFYRGQWERDRDCLWIQDFYATIQDYNACSAQGALANFLRDLTECRCGEHQRFVNGYLQSLFRNIDLTTVSARLVFSFPRSEEHEVEKELKGVWQQLSNAVKGLLEDLGCDANTRDASGSVLYAMAGSFGNLEAGFLVQMKHAMQGKSFPPVPISWLKWEDVNGVRCLWPSRQTALSSNYVALLGSMRPMPMRHWNKIKSNAAKETVENSSNPNARNPIFNIFCDAVPNPPLGLLHHNCHALSHAKVLIEIADDISFLYVGSHNFSKAAWGLNSASPKNVEVGVVLATKSAQVRQEWVSRLPYNLPDRRATSPDTYIPATGRGDIRSAYESGNPNADSMFRNYLSSSED